MYEPGDLEAVVGTTGGGVEIGGVTLMTIRNLRSGKTGMSSFVHRLPQYSQCVGGSVSASCGSSRFGCNSVPPEYTTACSSIAAVAGDWLDDDLVQILGDGFAFEKDTAPQIRQ